MGCIAPQPVVYYSTILIIFVAIAIPEVIPAVVCMYAQGGIGRRLFVQYIVGERKACPIGEMRHGERIPLCA